MDDEMRDRLRRTRRVASPWSDDETRGISGTRLDELLERWADGYDWGVHERRIAELPWQTVWVRGAEAKVDGSKSSAQENGVDSEPAVGAGAESDAHTSTDNVDSAGAESSADAGAVATAAIDTELRLIHQRSVDPDAPVVVLLHGWPDSVLRFERVLPLLTDMHVVVPALPGFPFAPPLTTSGMSVNRIAEIVAGGLAELGYARYTVSGGDVGGSVAEVLAGEYPERVAALHLTNVAPWRAVTADPAKLAPDAAAYLGRAAQWFRASGGYIAEQSTRPNTLAVALGDSPAGLAAWIVEKLEAWSDEAAFTVDELLTWVNTYWVTGTIGTSFATYAEPIVLAERIETPTVLSVFPRDTKPEPQSFAEAFLNVREYVRHPAGGHFAAWEQPAAYVDDLRRAVELGLAGRRS
jgi:pimeloyl-ACP methyl ester carboxylesterase